MRLLNLATIVLLAMPVQQAPLPVVSTEGLSTGPYARMHMLLEKTIFGIDVLTVEMRFDEPTRQHFRRIAGDGRYSDDLAEQIARAAVEAENAFVSVEFERDVSLHRWVEGVRENLRKACQWGVIDRQNYEDTGNQLPKWFGTIADRGFRDGDRILYRTYPDKLHTVLVGHNGDVLLDQTDSGSAPGRALLGGYFAPDGGFREQLVRSLLSDR